MHIWTIVSSRFLFKQLLNFASAGVPTANRQLAHTGVIRGGFVHKGLITETGRGHGGLRSQGSAASVLGEDRVNRVGAGIPGRKTQPVYAHFTRKALVNRCAEHSVLQDLRRIPSLVSYHFPHISAPEIPSLHLLSP